MPQRMTGMGGGKQQGQGKGLQGGKDHHRLATVVADSQILDPLAHPAGRNRNSRQHRQPKQRSRWDLDDRIHEAVTGPEPVVGNHQTAECGQLALDRLKTDRAGTADPQDPFLDVGPKLVSLRHEPQFGTVGFQLETGKRTVARNQLVHVITPGLQELVHGLSDLRQALFLQIGGILKLVENGLYTGLQRQDGVLLITKSQLPDLDL